MLAGSLLAISACGGDGSDPVYTGGSSPTLRGTAAVGAAVVGGTVTAKCADGSGFTAAVTTDTNGNWSGTLDAGVLPCALQVTGGTPPDTLYSYASRTGTVNITPLTTLALAQATSQLPADWFAAFDGTPVDVDSATDELLDALASAGFALPGSGNPFTTRFVTNGTGWDGLLDDLKQAITDDPTLADLDALLTLVKDGNLATSIPDAPAGGGPVDPELPANIEVLTAYAGSYTVSGTATDPANRGTATRDHDRGTITISANGDVDFDTGISFTSADIGAIYDRRNICDLDPEFQAACRVHVNYDEDDSGRKLEIYLAADKTTVLEIRYQDGVGGLTRAAIDNGGASTGDQSPVASADFTSYDTSTSASFLAGVTGTWPVAIYKVPEGQESLYGVGSLTVSGNESTWSMTLTGADGSVIFDRTNQGAINSLVSQFAQTLFITHGAAIDEYLSVELSADGIIEGYAGGQGEIEFRNALPAYGDTPPAVLALLAGNWEALYTLFCTSPISNVTNSAAITSTGIVTINGSTQQCTDAVDQVMTTGWNGRDDFIVPAPGETNYDHVLYLDAGSSAGIGNGAIEILFSNLASPSIYKIRSFAINGELFELGNPVRQ